VLQATQSRGGHRLELHRNAKLSVRGRELLIEGIEVAGHDGLWDRGSAPAVVANRTNERGRGDRRTPAAAVHRCEARRTAWDGCPDGLGDPYPRRDGEAGPDRPRANRSLRAPAPRSIDPHRCQEDWVHPSGRGASLHRQASGTPPAAGPTPNASAESRSAGSPSTSRSQRTGLRRSARRRERDPAIGFLRQPVAHSTLAASPSSV
jgi:hypothetical protein